MKRRLAGALALLAACSPPRPPAAYGETPAWREWSGSLIALQAAHFATKIDGSIDFDLGDRACGTQDWIEVAFNGEVIARKYIHVPEGQPPRILRMDLRFRTGPNWIAFFDTVTNRAYKFQIDTRTVNGQAADFVFTPGGPEGFEYTQTGR